MTESARSQDRPKRRRAVQPWVGWALAGLAVVGIAVTAFLLVGDDPSEDAKVAPALASAEASYASGEFEDAEAELTQLVEEDADDRAARKALALAHAAQGENEEALEQYAIVIESDPGDHETMYQMAVLERLIGKTDDAIAHFELAYEVKPEPQYADELARTYMQAGRYVDAVALWQAILDGGTLDEVSAAGVYAAMATAYEGARDYDKAKAALEEALLLTPNDTDLKARLEGFGN